MIQSTTGLIHTLAAMCALLTGIVIFFRTKATPFHRALGYVYSVSMTVMLVTAFLTYDLTKSFNFVHVFAVASSAQLTLGFWATFRRRRGWLAKHYHWMCYSYIGLCDAFVAETATRIVMPYLIAHYQINSMGWFWVIVGSCSFGVFVVGKWLIERNKQLVAKFQNDQAFRAISS
jgi:uncharacterized membrane protein